MSNIIRRNQPMSNWMAQPAWLEDFFSPFLRDFWGMPLSREHQAFRVDIKQTDDAYILEAEMPGLQKEDIDLRLEDNVLTISAQHNVQTEQEKEGFVIRERHSGSWRRSFSMEQIDTEGIKAEYKDGILRLELPKKQEQRKANGRNIDIQ